jgi:anti-sigma factor RsiW
LMCLGMRTMLLAAIVVPAGAAAVLAAPASADEQLDQAFLTALRDKGIVAKSEAFALELAHSTCDVLNGGGTVEEALQQIKAETKWSDKKSLDFGGLAVYAYCKDKLPQ